MIDKYRIVRKLGTGTFGRVFLCVAPNESARTQTTPKSKGPKNTYRLLAKGRFNKKGDDAERARRDEEALLEAEATVSQCQVAVKVIRPVPKYVKEAQDESEWLKKL
jgi:hypothetical protein